MKFHADDLGASRSVTKAILECHRAGALSGASLMVNQPDLPAALSDLRDCPNLPLRLHLNLTDGRPLSEHEEVPLLCDEEGAFRHSFQSLMRGVYHPRTKAAYLRQVEREMRAQLLRFREVRETLGRTERVALDSHEHIHFLPPLLTQILNLREEFLIEEVRMPWATLYLSHFVQRSAVSLLKQLVLTALGCLNKLRLPREIRSPRLLLTGSVNPTRIPEVLKREGVEVIFHPGRMSKEEAVYWEHQSRHYEAYQGEFRELEHRALVAWTQEN